MAIKQHILELELAVTKGTLVFPMDANPGTLSFTDSDNNALTYNVLLWVIDRAACKINGVIVDAADSTKVAAFGMNILTNEILFEENISNIAVNGNYIAFVVDGLSAEIKIS